MKKVLRIVLFLLIVAFSTTASYAQVVGEKENLENVFIEAKQLTNFFKSNYLKEEVAFEQLKMIEKDGAFYLLAKEVGKNRVFAFKLFRKPLSSPLKLVSFNTVHSCATDEISIDVFNFDGKKIRGCSVGYTIYGNF